MTDPNAPFFAAQETIRLRADGQWMSDETEITHAETCRMFFRHLQRDERGWYLQVGRETQRVEVEDCAFFITRVEGDPEVGYTLLLSDETQVSLDPGELRYRPGRLTAVVTTRLGPQEARFQRNPYFELLRHLEEDAEGYFLTFAGSKVRLAGK